MKRALSISAVVATGFIACAAVGISQAQPKGGGGGHFDPHNPKVYVLGKYLVVDQEPIVILKDDKRTDITWELPPRRPIAFMRTASRSTPISSWDAASLPAGSSTRARTRRDGA